MNGQNKQWLRLYFYDHVVLVSAHLAKLIDNSGCLLALRAFFCKNGSEKINLGNATSNIYIYIRKYI